MAQYTKVNEIVDVVQVTDAKESLDGVTLAYYVTGKDDLCPKCGQLVSLHRKHVIYPKYMEIVLCPGSWIVKREDGRIEYLSDTDFKARYEVVKDV